MRLASPALIALLAGNQFVMADLYTFTFPGGSILRFSDRPTPINANGFVFQLGPKFERSRTKTNTGIQVDELTVNVYPELGDLIGTTLFLQALWTGQFEGALLQLERAFMPTYGDTSPGTVVLFAGRISNIDASRTGATISVRSHLELLNIQMPRRLWQPSCMHIFGGPMCLFNRSSLALTFAASSPDGTISTGPSGTALTTAAGSWTWGGSASGSDRLLVNVGDVLLDQTGDAILVQAARPGEFFVDLNGTMVGIGIVMEVANGGQLYVNTLSLGWFVWTGSGFVSSSPPGAQSSTAIQINGAPVTTTPFVFGTITGLTGANAGYSRTIYGFASGGFVSIKLAFLFPIAGGDQFQILPGCDKTAATCQNKFNNAVHFGGFPYIPTPESAI